MKSPPIKSKEVETAFGVKHAVAAARASDNNQAFALPSAEHSKTDSSRSSSYKR